MDFKPVFSFFGVPETGNLLADITLLHQVFVKESSDDEETVEMSKAQAKRVARLEKMLLQRLLHYIFEFYDKDGSGHIETSELFQFMKDVISVMPPQYYADSITGGDSDAIDAVTSKVLVEFMDECDDDEDGMISYEELAHQLPNIFRRMVASS
jgi:Ca2+-binding EF-hand superfamily protein